MFHSTVSQDILQKSIGSMQGGLKKLEKEIESFQPSSPEDKFGTIMKISFILKEMFCCLGIGFGVHLSCESVFCS